MLNRETTDKFLSKQEQEKITSFVKDETMKEAVRKVLLSMIYYNGTLKADEKADPLKNAALSLVAKRGLELSDEQIGKDLKVMWSGIDLLEMAFQQMETYNQKEYEKKDNKNIAR